MRILILTASLLVLVSCATPYKPNNNLPLQTAEGKAISSGIILGSVTAGSRYMNVQARFESTDGQGYYGVVQSHDDLGDSAREHPLRYRNIFGDTFVTRIPAGNYAFTSWKMTVPANTEMLSPENLTPVPFTVNPGETVYLGNIHFPQLETRDANGPRIPTGTWAITNNREIRDSDAIYLQHPELKTVFVTRRVLDGAIWRGDYLAATGDELDDPMH